MLPCLTISIQTSTVHTPNNSPKSQSLSTSSKTKQKQSINKTVKKTMKMKLNFFKVGNRKKASIRSTYMLILRELFTIQFTSNKYPPRRPKRANKSICQFAHVRRTEKYYCLCCCLIFMNYLMRYDQRYIQ